MPPYLVKKTESIRERNDFRTMPLDKMFRKLKNLEIELDQKRKYMVEISSGQACGYAKDYYTLADEPYFSYQELIDFGQFEYSSAKSDYSSVKSEYTPTKPKIIEDKIDEVFMNPTDEFYTLEELQQQRISPWLIWMQGSSISTSEGTPATISMLK